MKGETIKEKLSQLGRTQRELAGLLGVTPQAVYEIMSSSDVRSGTIERISQVLGVPISFFFDEENASIDATEDSFMLGGKIRPTNNIGKKVRVLLKEQHKTIIDLSRHVGMTDAGIRKMFERDTCNISTLIKIADYLGVPVNHFLPENSTISRESLKDKEIEFLKGQIKAYENALSAFSHFSNEAKLPKLSVG